MGNQYGLPRINEVAFFLDKHATQTKARFEAEGGEFADLMTPGMMGGDAEVSEDLARKGLHARATILSAALSEGAIAADAASETVNAKLAALRRLRFASVVFAAVGASSVLGAVFIAKAVTLVAGSIALGANVAGMTADHLVLGGSLKEADLVEVAKSLSRLSRECPYAQRLLDVLGQGTFDLEDMKYAISDGNRLFGELNAALSQVAGLGSAASRKPTR